VGFRVGVVWKGNPAHEQDRTRSIVWEKFVSLLNVPGVCYYSLQVGASESEAAALAEAGIIDWTAQLGDFSDTAAFVAELDLIISVDTAVAHLAGAMSRPVWTLLPFVPDWRWGAEGESTAWYSTMRLFRQPRPWDWEAVVGRVREELERRMTNDEFLREQGGRRSGRISRPRSSAGI
jgi:ADP-heptose:LPS heptosyltransferase